MTIVNMPSLARVLEILREPVAIIDAAPRDPRISGMHVEAPRASVRITTSPTMTGDLPQ